MDREQFEQFFSYICEKMAEADQEEHFGLKAAYGAGNDESAEMLFLLAQSYVRVHLDHVSNEPLSQEECLDMIHSVESHTGGFRQLFVL